MANEGLAGIAAKDGKLLWKYAKKPAYSDVVIPTPVVHDEYVYATAGWGAGCCQWPIFDERSNGKTPVSPVDRFANRTPST